MRKNRGKIGKITDFLPKKLEIIDFSTEKNRTCDSRTKDACHLQKIGDKLKKSAIFDDFLRKKADSQIVSCFLSNGPDSVRLFKRIQQLYFLSNS